MWMRPPRLLCHLAVAGSLLFSSSPLFSQTEPNEYIRFKAGAADFFKEKMDQSEFSDNHFPYHGESYTKIIHATPDNIVKIFGARREIKDVKDAPEVKAKLITADDYKKDAILGEGEFYTRIAIEQFIDKNKFQIEYCSDLKSNWFNIVEMSINYVGKVSRESSYVPMGPIVLLATGINESGGALRKGCTASTMPLKQHGPYILYQNFLEGQGEYKLRFKVTAGTLKGPSRMALFNEVATAAVGFLLPQLAIPAGLASFVAKSTSAYDQINKDRAEVWISDRSAIITSKRRFAEYTEQELKTADPVGKSYRPIASPHVAIWLPWAEYKTGNKHKLGQIEVYQSRSVSIAIDHFKGTDSSEEIKPQDILQNRLLAEPHTCLPGPSCAVQKEVNFFSDAFTPRISEFLDKIPESWPGIFKACKKIRDEASRFGLSKVDALLVRWALLEDIGLLKIIRDYQETGASPHAGAIAAVKMPEVLPGKSQPDQLCWERDTDKEAKTGGDNERMQALTSVMGVKFQGVPDLTNMRK